jgi:hypothetical protein
MKEPDGGNDATFSGINFVLGCYAENTTEMVCM